MSGLLSVGADRVSTQLTNPLPTTPRDFWEREALSYEDDRTIQASDSRTRNRSAAYARAADELRRYGGNWTNPVSEAETPRQAVDSLNAPETDADADSFLLRDQWRQRVEQLQREHPDEAASLAQHLPEAIEARSNQEIAQAHRSYEALQAVDGAWSVAGTIGGLRAALRDPLNIVTMPLGAGRVGGGIVQRVLTTALREGAIGGATQAAVDASAAPYRVEIGLEANVGSNILMGALGGAVLGGGLRALSEGWRALRLREPAPDGATALREADAATVMDTLRRETITNPGRIEQAEMHLAALDRATEAVTTGRIAEDASLVVPPAARAAEMAGDTMRVYTPTGRAVDVQPQVVELADLIPSHTDDFAINAAYPHAEGVQPRDRSRDASVNQVQQIAGNLEPERLKPSPEAGNGAPIIDGENVVESGNGRVLALRQVYGDPANAARADAYRAMLTAAGHDVQGFAAPVLVSRRVSALAPDERRAFVREANAETALGLGAAEQARVDAEQVGRIIDLYRGGDVASAENAAFVRGFMRGLPQTAQGRMVGPDGLLSSEGARRLRGAVLARAYGDEMGNLLERITEGDAEGLKSIAGALQDVSARWAAMRSAAAHGEIAPAMDTTADLFAAVNTVSLARQKRMPVADVLAQADFDTPPLSDTGRAMLATMYRDPQLRGAAGREAISARLNGYLDEAMQTRAGADLFGSPPPTPTHVMAALARREMKVSSARAGGLHAPPELEIQSPRLTGALSEITARLLPGQDLVIRLAELAPDLGKVPNGSLARDASGGGFILTLRPGMSPADTARTAVHEVGHAFHLARFEVAPRSVQEGIIEQWSREIGANGDAAVYRLGLTEAALDGDDVKFERIVNGFRGEHGGLRPKPEHVAYANQFKEWFAEKFAEWAVTDRGSNSAIGRFFGAVGDLVREAFRRANAALGIQSDPGAFERFAQQAWDGSPPTAASGPTDPMRGRQSAAAAAGDRSAEIAALQKVPDAEVLEAQRIAAEQDVMIPDATGEPRSLRDQLDEADNAIADAAGAAACLIGAAAT